MTYILALIVAVIVIAADQIAKSCVAANLTLGCRPTTLIPGLIDLTYIHNRGGAWGILSSQRWILLALTVVAMLICGYILFKTFRKNAVLFWGMALVLSGGIGNMYDRVFRDGNVIDFLQFHFWKSFPIFNIADCAAVIGCGLLILYVILDMFKQQKPDLKECIPDETI